MALIVQPNGDIEWVKPSNGTDFSLQEMQQAVGGYAEMIYLKDGNIMVVDEDYLLKYEGGLHNLNLAATSLMTTTRGEAYPVFGPVLICKGSEIR